MTKTFKNLILQNKIAETIGLSGTTKFVQLMILDWALAFLLKGQL